MDNKQSKIALSLIVLAIMALAAIGVSQIRRESVQQAGEDTLDEIRRLRGRREIVTVFDRRQIWNESVPVVVVATMTSSERGWHVRGGSIRNRSPRTVEGVSLRWTVTPFDQPNVVLNDGVTGRISVNVPPGERRALRFPDMNFRRILRPLVRNETLEGRFLITIRVTEAYFTDGSQWAEVMRRSLVPMERPPASVQPTPPPPNMENMGELRFKTAPDASAQPTPCPISRYCTETEDMMSRSCRPDPLPYGRIICTDLPPNPDGSRNCYHDFCEGTEPCPDNDGDGVRSCEGDCNDDPNNGGRNVNPTAIENCTDDVDNDCDGNANDRDSDCQTCFNADGDAYSTCEGDCRDDNPAINPGATELAALGNCSDGVDNDCDGREDGLDASCTPPSLLPGSEVCGDGIDNNGDGLIDEGCGGRGGEPEACTPYYWQVEWYFWNRETNQYEYGYTEYRYAGCW